MTDLKQGLGRIIFVLGEAGLGKTRLISEAHEVFKLSAIRRPSGSKRSVSLMRRIKPMDYSNVSCAALAELNITMRPWSCVRN